MARVTVFGKAQNKSAQCGAVEASGKSFVIHRPVMADGPFSVTAWDDRPEDGTVKLVPGLYRGPSNETVRVYRTRSGKGASVNVGIGGVLAPGRYSWKADHPKKEAAAEAEVPSQPTGTPAIPPPAPPGYESGEGEVVEIEEDDIPF